MTEVNGQTTGTKVDDDTDHGYDLCMYQDPSDYDDMSPWTYNLLKNIYDWANDKSDLMELTTMIQSLPEEPTQEDVVKVEIAFLKPRSFFIDLNPQPQISAMQIGSGIARKTLRFIVDLYKPKSLAYKFHSERTKKLLAIRNIKKLLNKYSAV
jgi:hypothetical protein